MVKLRWAWGFNVDYGFRQTVIFIVGSSDDVGLEQGSIIEGVGSGGSQR